MVSAFLRIENPRGAPAYPQASRHGAFIFVAVIFVSLPSVYAQQESPTTGTAPVQNFQMNFGNTRWFPNFWEPYQVPFVPEPKMGRSDRSHSLVSDGKLHLSLEDTIALALENNLDIAVARFEPAYAQTDLLRTKSGGAPRGVQGAFSSSALYAGAIGGGLSKRIRRFQFRQWRRADRLRGSH